MSKPRGKASATPSKQWIVVVAAIVGALLSSGFSVFLIYFWLQPNVLYQVLQPYKLSSQDQVVLIRVLNEGHGTATKLGVTIEAVGPILGLHCDSEESVVSRYEKNIASLNCSRLVSGDFIAVYLRIATESQDPITRVSVRHDHGKGAPKARDSGTTLYAVILQVVSFIILAVMFVWELVAHLKPQREREIAHTSEAGTEPFDFLSGIHQGNNYCAGANI